MNPTNGHGTAQMLPKAWWEKPIMLPVVCLLLPILGLCCLILLPAVVVIEKRIFKL